MLSVKGQDEDGVTRGEAAVPLHILAEHFNSAGDFEVVRKFLVQMRKGRSHISCKSEITVVEDAKL